MAENCVAQCLVAELSSPRRSTPFTSLVPIFILPPISPPLAAAVVTAANSILRLISKNYSPSPALKYIFGQRQLLVSFDPCSAERFCCLLKCADLIGSPRLLKSIGFLALAQRQVLSQAWLSY